MTHHRPAPMVPAAPADGAPPHVFETLVSGGSDHLLPRRAARGGEVSRVEAALASRLTMPWCARDCSKKVENHERPSRSIFNVVQLRPRASDPPRYAGEGDGRGESGVERRGNRSVAGVNTSMRMAALFVALFTIVVGIGGLISPESGTDIRRLYFATPVRLYTAGAIRVAM